MPGLIYDLMDVLEKECELYSGLLIKTKEKTQIIIENNLEVKIIYISKENEQKIKDMFLLKNMSFNKISKIIGIDYRNIKKLLDIK